MTVQQAWRGVGAAAILWLALMGLALAQPAPPSQCVSAALAGGTANALTVPQLPCGATSTLLIMTPSLANTSTVPTLQPVGLAARVIKRFDGTALAAGDLPAGSKVLLTYNGVNWFLLNGAGSSAFPTGIELCGAFASCSDLSVTGAMSAGGTLLTTSVALDLPSTCLAGDLRCGVLVEKAGPAFAIGKPASPAVASYCTVQNVNGNTTNGSRVVTGLVGLRGIAVGDTITGTGIPASTTVASFSVSAQTLRLSAAATTTAFSGFTITDPCTATYSYKLASLDSAGGVGAPTATLTTTAGPVHLSTWNVNCLTWAVPADASSPAGYVVWRSLDGGGTWAFFQTANTEGSGSCLVGTNGPLWDGGQTAQARPWWIPNDPNTIGAGGQADWLPATVIAGGGTTGLRLSAANAGGPLTGARVWHDDTAGWLAWVAALNAGPARGKISGPATVRTRTGGTVTAPGVTVSGFGNVVLKPVGAAVGPLLKFAGAVVTSTATPTGNWQEGSNCLPLSASPGNGAWVVVQQDGPGGPSQSLPYVMVSNVVSDSCDGGGIQMADSAPITFTDSAHTETATISGVTAVGDTVTLTESGDVVCSATYTVISGDTLTLVARGLALAVNANCTGNFATHTGAVVKVQLPQYTSGVAFGHSETHGGGGTEAIVLATGIGWSFTVINPVYSVGLRGVTVDGQAAVGNRSTGPLLGASLDKVLSSKFENLTLINFGGGAAGLLTSYGYGNTFSDLYLVNASGGTPNVTSYSDFWLVGETKPFVSRVRSINANSFGPQLGSVSGAIVDGLKSIGTQFGRGFKLAAVAGSEFSNIEVDGGVFDSLAICCGTYRNSFHNVRTTNARGVNQAGIGMFDAWDRLNSFSGVKSVGSPLDVIVDVTDRGNVWNNVDFGLGSGFATTYVFNSTNLWSNINRCEVAQNPTPGATQALSCQRQQGTWVPTFAGATTAGTATYSIQLGSWEQNDEKMTVRFSLQTTGALAGGAAGDLVVTGLPLPPSGMSNDFGTCSLTNATGITLDGGYTWFSGIVGAFTASGQIKLAESGSAVSQYVPVGNAAGAFQLFGTCDYKLY